MRKLFNRSLSILCILALCASLLPATLAAPDPTITVQTKTVTVAEAADPVTVELTLANNPGLTGVAVKVAYDAKLTLTGAANGTALTGLSYTPNGSITANPYTLAWGGAAAASGNGTMATLTFTVPQEAGTYPITLSYTAGDIIDDNLDDVNVTLVNGSITVEAPSVPSTDPTITAETKTISVADAASPVTVELALANNPGLTGVAVKVAYDAKLTLTGAANGTALTGLSYTPNGSITANPYTLAWGGAAAASGNGTMATLTFTVPQEAGTYPITLSYTAGDIIDDNLDDVNVTLVNGSITVEGAAHTHTLTHHAAVPATCTTAGNVEYWSCSNCNKNYSDAAGTAELMTVTVAATGHNLTHHAAVAASCTAAGSVEYWSCSNCNKNFSDAAGTTEITTVTVAATGHNMTYHAAVAPTATEAGNIEYWSCSNCNKNFSNVAGTIEVATVIVPALGETTTITAETKTITTADAASPVTVDLTIANNPGLTGVAIKIAYDTNLALTAIENGTALAGLSFTPPGNFTANPVNAVWGGAAAASGNGKLATLTFTVPQTVGTYPITLSYKAGGIIDNDLNDVNVVMVAGSITVEAPAHTHTLTHHAAVPATCTAAGNVEYWSCTCGKNFSDAAGTTEIASVTVAATGHSMTHHAAVPATCTAAGNVEYWSCSNCNKNFSDATGTTELATVTVAATGHSLTHHAAVAATETTDGNIEYWSCSNCNKNFSDTAATVEVATVIIPALGHTHVLTHHAAVPATCTAAGNVEYWSCTCGKKFSDAAGTTEITTVTIPALGHDLIHHDAKAPTETSVGWNAYDTCSRCDYTTYVEIPAIGTSPALTVQSRSLTVGSSAQSVDLQLILSNNPGLAGATISVSYDADLTLTAVSAGTALGSLSFLAGGDLTANPIRLVWYGAGADASNGTLATLTFTVPAAAKVYPVSVSVKSALDNALKPVAIKTEAGGFDVGCGTTAADHSLTYTASGAVLTETCSVCGHTATATLVAAPATYTGNEVAPVSVTLGSGWLSGTPVITYSNNINAGTGTATATLGDATATIDFTIDKSSAYTITLDNLDQSLVSAANSKPVSVTVSASDGDMSIVVEYCVGGVWTTEKPVIYGTFPVRATVSSANLATQTVNGTLVITQKDPVVIPTGGGASGGGSSGGSSGSSSGSNTPTPPPAPILIPGTTDYSTSRFVDVKSTDYYYESVNWAAEQGITSGTGDGSTFSPNASATRAQTVTFLWKAMGCPEPTNANKFSDVKSGDYYYKAVAWAAEQGITSGTGDGSTFSPDDIVTRAQIVTFLYRLIGQKPNGSSGFTDVKSSDYYSASVAWAAQNGITAGTGNGKFSPNDDCLRGQIATFLYKCFGN